jgi:hypothetical protein
MSDRTCDFLCIGGGLGGLAGAIKAHDSGLETLIVERSDLLGGVAAYSGGVVWVPGNHLQTAGGFPDERGEAERYMDFLTPEGVQADRELRAAFLETAPRATEYFHREAHVAFEVVQRPDQYHPAPGSLGGGRTLEVTVSGADLGEWQRRCRPNPHFKIGLTNSEVLVNGGPTQAYQRLARLYEERVGEDFRTHGPGLASAFVKAAVVDRSVPVLLNTRAVRLTQENGAVTGAVVEIEGRSLEIRARRGVLLATGSYGSAPWAARTEGLPDLVEASPPIIDGDGLTLADPTPAAVIRAGEAVTLVAFHSPGETHPGTDTPLYREIIAAMGYPHSIVVNREGRRFADESFYGRFFTAVKAFNSHTKKFLHYPCYLIVDDIFRRRYSFGPFEPGDPWPDSFSRADDLRVLAAQVGIDGVGLEDEVSRFNKGAAAGVDHDFGRGEVGFVNLAMGDPTYPNPNLGTIAEPPFWAIPLRIMGLGIYSMGLAVDGSGRVLTRGDEPVPGMYATGNAVAYTEMCGGYQGGFANARNITYAHNAAADAARH